jgi:hypothetical protein
MKEAKTEEQRKILLEMELAWLELAETQSQEDHRCLTNQPDPNSIDAERELDGRNLGELGLYRSVARAQPPLRVATNILTSSAP